MGFENATPIQEQTIPKILDNKDLIACAQTGTGKTAAFLLPVLNKIASQENQGKSVNTLVIAPTRELALQIDQQVEALGYFLGVSSLPVYGGGQSQEWDQQKRALSQGADIIIATPGRLIAHLNMGYVNFNNLQHLILDVAARMLDMGFLSDILKIVDYLPKERQTLLFSATMPSKIRTLAKKILNKPESVNIAISKPAAGILQGAYLVHDKQKIDLITELLKNKEETYSRVIIFTSTKRAVNDIRRRLQAVGLSAAGISSDLDQKEREQALKDFKNKQTQILVATDILARGIDIKEINLVINFEVPSDAEDYVHRIGRTARADAKGVALTFISADDVYKFIRIERVIETEVQKIPLPAGFAPGPEYKITRGGGGGSRGRHKGRGGRNGGSGGNRNRGGGGGRNKRKGSGGNRNSNNRNSSNRNSSSKNRSSNNRANVKKG